MDDIKHHQVALDLQQGTIKAEPGEDIGQLIMERHPCAVIENEDDYSVLALSGPAGFGGVVVALKSGNSLVASVPFTVTVPQGSTTATFSINTSTVASAQIITITATAGSISETATLTVE